MMIVRLELEGQGHCPGHCPLPMASMIVAVVYVIPCA